MAEIDWTERWRDLVADRDADRGQDRPQDYWDQRAAVYHRYASGWDEPFLEFIEPYLGPRRTLIDVGAGTGRYAAALAERLDWVTAVEPSAGMRALMPPRSNLTLVASAWEDAEVAPADLVISCHVVHMLPAPLPFIRKMEAAARERVFVLIRDLPMDSVVARLRELLTGSPGPPQPLLWDLYNLLRQAGIHPDLSMLRHRSVQSFESMDTALDDCRYQLGSRWNEDIGSRWLAENLKTDDDGGLAYIGGEMVSGVAHWSPSPS